jgi:sodium transport system permease protein
VVILLCFTGAMYPAMDLTAGEKERGTMETLLCTPVARLDLVLGKFLMVLTGSLATVILAGLSAAVTLPLGGLLVGGGGFTGEGGASLALDPLGLLTSVVLVLPVAVLFAATLFTLALFARTLKEAQSTISPLVVVVMLPSLAALLPGVELTPGLALVPILNVALASKALVSGVFDWPLLALIFGSTTVYAAGALLAAVRMFGRESVILRM